MKKTVQYFTEEYLNHCKKMKPEQIVEFLENFRSLHGKRTQAKQKARLISIRIPEDLLRAFQLRSEAEGVPYQTQIKELMRDWLEKGK